MTTATSQRLVMICEFAKQLKVTEGRINKLCNEGKLEKVITKLEGTAIDVVRVDANRAQEMKVYLGIVDAVCEYCQAIFDLDTVKFKDRNYCTRPECVKKYRDSAKPTTSRHLGKRAQQDLLRKEVRTEIYRAVSAKRPHADPHWVMPDQAVVITGLTRHLLEWLCERGSLTKGFKDGLIYLEEEVRIIAEIVARYDIPQRLKG